MTGYSADIHQNLYLQSQTLYRTLPSERAFGKGCSYAECIFQQLWSACTL